MRTKRNRTKIITAKLIFPINTLYTNSVYKRFTDTQQKNFGAVV